VRVAANLFDFWRAPVGSVSVEKSFLVFSPDPSLVGYVLWGELRSDDLEACAAAVARELADDVPRHRSYVDLRRVTWLDPSAHAILSSFVGKHDARIKEQFIDMVLVRPEGWVGALLEGLVRVIPLPHHMSIVSDPRDALRRLEIHDDALLADLDGIVSAEIETEPDALRRLRTLLDATQGRMELADTAKALGSAPRTLQRSLADHGTSFQQEKNRAQMLAAQRLLLRTNAKLSQIAHEVGCASAQHFSTLFRRFTGESPSDWRKLRRRDGG
jgi:AraC-like DNA-binding protein